MKICVVCHTEKSIDDFYNKHRDCKQCKYRKVSKRFYDRKDRILQKQKDK